MCLCSLSRSVSVYDSLSRSLPFYLPLYVPSYRSLSLSTFLPISLSLYLPLSSLCSHILSPSVLSPLSLSLYISIYIYHLISWQLRVFLFSLPGLYQALRSFINEPAGCLHHSMCLSVTTESLPPDAAAFWPYRPLLVSSKDRLCYSATRGKLGHGYVERHDPPCWYRPFIGHRSQVLACGKQPRNNNNSRINNR